MKRLCYFIALMALSSSAHADSFSFVVAGHRIRIEAPGRCRSASCVSVSIPGIYRSNRWRDRDDDVAASSEPAPVNPPPPAQSPAPLPQLAATTTQTIAPPPPPSVPVVSMTQPVVVPPPPKLEPVKTIAAEIPVVAPKPVPVPVAVPAPQTTEVSQQTEDEPADTPLGDWQTEGNKGSVRIERCGQAMCGYVLNLASNAKGDTVLINMKSKSDTLWSGNIYSRSSGATYYSTMTMKGANTLRVEACALGRFFCSGNDWTRLENPSRLISYRQISARPPS
jgi:uncharacterized protein (DUF2147 family)